MEIKNKYSGIVNKVYEDMKMELGTNLLFFQVIGSSSSEKVYENFSDIDLIIVLDEYKTGAMDKIIQITSNYYIKIGTTVYCKEEFENKLIDPKTYYYLYLVQKKIICNNYCSKKLILPIVSFRELQTQYETWLNEHIHAYKRYFLCHNFDKKSKRDIFKNTYLIMKAILVINGFTPNNYDEVFDTFFKQYNYEQFNYKNFIKLFVNNSNVPNDIIDYGKRFAIYLSKNISVRKKFSKSVKIIDSDQMFKYRVSAIVIRDNKLLVDFVEGSPYCNLIGGYVNIFEDSRSAIKREFKEETNIDVTICKYYGIIENFFQNKKCQKVHEIAIYYFVDSSILPNNDFSVKEKETYEYINHNFKWINIDDLEKYNFKPNVIVQKLKNRNSNNEFFHLINEYGEWVNINE